MGARVYMQHNVCLCVDPSLAAALQGSALQQAVAGRGMFLAPPMTGQPGAMAAQAQLMAALSAARAMSPGGVLLRAPTGTAAVPQFTPYMQSPLAAAQAAAAA
jgi:hypothetical protein